MNAGASPAPSVPVAAGREGFKAELEDLRHRELARLRGEYPAWHIWLSQARRWWATRKGRIAPDSRRDPGWSMTVDADTAEALGRRLEEQGRCAGTGAGRTL